MEHQAGTGWTGPAGEDSARDSESNDRERALADSAGGETGSTGAAQGGSGPAESRGAAAVVPATPPVPGSPVPGSPVPELPATGEPRVDAALKLLERLPGLAVSDHPELFEQVHAQLSEVLGELDSGAGPAGA